MYLKEAFVYCGMESVRKMKAASFTKLLFIFTQHFYTPDHDGQPDNSLMAIDVRQEVAAGLLSSLIVFFVVQYE